MAKIVIDAGHGLYTAGKRCMKKLDKNQTREWILNDRVADALERYLKAAGHEVLRVDDPTGERDVPLAERVRKANAWGADYYISVHHNSGVGGTAGGGTVVYVCKNCQKKSVEVQEAIYKHCITEADLKGNRWDGTVSQNFYVIRHTNMPAALVECGFMDSSTDIKFILDPEWSKKIALGIAKGICEEFGGKVDASSADTGTTKPTPKPKEEGKLAEDGKWGKDTTKATQRFLGTTVDGIVSNQPECNEEHLPNAFSISWEFKEDDYENGSNMVRALQKLIGAEVDGWFGEESVTYLQEFLNKHGYNFVVDGSMGPKTVAAWQNYLNNH